MKKVVFLGVAVSMIANNFAFASTSRIERVQQATAQDRQILKAQLIRDLADAKKNLAEMEYNLEAKRGEMLTNGLETVTLFIGGATEGTLGTIITNQLIKAKSSQAQVVGFATTSIAGLLVVFSILRGKEMGLNMHQAEELQKLIANAKAEVEVLLEQINALESVSFTPIL